MTYPANFADDTSCNHDDYTMGCQQCRNAMRYRLLFIEPTGSVLSDDEIRAMSDEELERRWLFV